MLSRSAGVLVPPADGQRRAGPGRRGLAGDDDGLAHDDAVDIVGGRGRAVIELVDGDDFAVEDFEAGFFRRLLDGQGVAGAANGDVAFGLDIDAVAAQAKARVALGDARVGGDAGVELRGRRRIEDFERRHGVCRAYPLRGGEGTIRNNEYECNEE